MISKSQQEMFDKIKDGAVTAKQKGDFYYRMSKVLQKKLDELEAISFLLKEIPLSYQDKIDLRRPAIQAMKITDQLIERLDPAFISPIIKDKDGKECDYERSNGGAHFVGRRIIRRYKINLKSYLPGLTGSTATIRVSYEPTKEEVEFLHQVTEHQCNIAKIRAHSERPPRLYSTREFNERVIPTLKSRGMNFKYETEAIVGWPVKGMPSDAESISQFDEIDGILDKKEEPK